MNSFLKIFLACIAALVVFSIMAFFIMMGLVTGLSVPEKTKVAANSVLLIDLSQHFAEIEEKNLIAKFAGGENYDVPSLTNLVRLIRRAKADSAIKGIFLKCDNNNNGFGASDEIRNALLDYKKANKFIIAYGDVMPQSAYRIASVANKVYCHPKGGVEWIGLGMQLAFVKGTLEKLEIEPQIFYAGKFKSATEPFREKQMTPANRLQLTELLNDLYSHFLNQVATSRKIDTASLRRFADEHTIKFAEDALQNGLVDGLKYDDEVKQEIQTILKARNLENVNYLPVGKYARSLEDVDEGKDRIAVIYAEGDIIDGKGGKGQIGSDEYRRMIRKVRLDENIDAIVFRINSGGGSALASENIWRELTLARKEKPVVVSFGDVSASGGYYLSCNADTIFAQPNTITGSIGVFALIPNMQQFFNKKLGVTFDEVRTAGEGRFTVSKPLTAMQKTYIQSHIDTIYHYFKSRVAEGRNRSMEYVDSIAQGRVWSGSRAVDLGLVDRLGGLQDAIDCAAGMAKVKKYQLKEYPGERSFFEELFGEYYRETKSDAVRQEVGEDGRKVYSAIKKVRDMIGTTQARLPFDLSIQ